MNLLVVASDIVMALVFLLRINRLPPQIPLFYSKATGEDQLGDTWMIFVIPAFMTVFFAINNFIYRKYFSGDEIAVKVFYYLNIFLIISSTVIFVRIVYLIT